MSKTELLQKLHTAARTEQAAAVTTRNMIATFTWSGLDETALKEITGTLEKLASSHGARAAELNRLITELERSPKDVF